jgi:hypothetical protein
MRELSMMPWPRQAAIAGAVGLATALLGPFGTAVQLPPLPRAIYWVPLIALGWFQFVTIAAMSDRVELLARRSLAVRFAAVIALAALPTALEVTAVNAVFLKQHQTLASFLTTYWQCALVGALILVPMHLIAVRALQAPEPDAPPAAAAGPLPAAPAPRFIERLPPAARGRLLALEMEDHYLRVHTDAGSTLILHRMSDAAAELAGTDGWRVHRSWWVAADAVRTVRRDGGRATLMLANGLAVPVSRSAWRELRDRLQAVPEG